MGNAPQQTLLRSRSKRFERQCNRQEAPTPVSNADATTAKPPLPSALPHRRPHPKWSVRKISSESENILGIARWDARSYPLGEPCEPRSGSSPPKRPPRSRQRDGESLIPKPKQRPPRAPRTTPNKRSEFGKTKGFRDPPAANANADAGPEATAAIPSDSSLHGIRLWQNSYSPDSNPPPSLARTTNASNKKRLSKIALDNVQA